MTSSTTTLSLVTWAMTHLAALYTAQNQSALVEAYGSFVASSANITFNGVPMNSLSYMNQFSTETFLERNCSISFLGSVSAAVGSSGNDTQAANATGMVGLFYSVTVIENILFEGAPLTHVANSSINLQVESVAIPIGPITPGEKVNFDDRRAVSINQISLD